MTVSREDYNLILEQLARAQKALHKLNSPTLDRDVGTAVGTDRPNVLDYAIYVLSTAQVGLGLIEEEQW